MNSDIICPTAGTEVYKRLHNKDWTFAGASTNTQTHGIHPYPAKFIPQIPRNLIRELFRNDGTVVMDPFCGSGTTLVEAARVGIPSVGIDLHPLACLISKVKVTPLQGSLVLAADRALRTANDVSRDVPDIPALDHWFKKEIQASLANLTFAIDLEPDADIRDALKIALSSIIVRVSNQESDTRYAAIDKDVCPSSVRDGFRIAAMNVEDSINSAWVGQVQRGRVRILNKNILEVSAIEIAEPVSLVVTSPPYPNAYEYWLYHKYRMYWLGMDPINVRANEIGARPHYFKSNPQTPEDFEKQMTTVFQMMSHVVVPGGHVCMVIGSSVIHGKEIDNASIIYRSASSNSFDLRASIDRRIPSTSKAFNAKVSRIKEEKLLIFQAR